MHILLTRPLEDCSEMILKFKSLGHQVSHIPLINIEKVNYEEIKFSEYGGIIFTSANAVKYLDQNNIDKNIKCFCVGNLTEKKARSSGFQNTIAAEGNVSNLKELILQTYETKSKKLLYVSGEIISVDLDQQLMKEGYGIKRVINYRVKHNQKFNESFVKDLKLNMPDMVYIYSQNSAQSFLSFVKNHQFENLSTLTAIPILVSKSSLFFM